MKKKVLTIGVVIAFLGIFIYQHCIYVVSIKQIKELKSSSASMKSNIDTCFSDRIKKAADVFDRSTNGQVEFAFGYNYCKEDLEVCEVLSEYTSFQINNNELHDALHDFVVMMECSAELPIIQEDKLKVRDILQKISEKPGDVENTKKLSDYDDYLIKQSRGIWHYGKDESPNFSALTTKRYDKISGFDVVFVSPTTH